MPLTDELSRAQRVVVVIALGLALGATGTYLAGLGSGTGIGWYAYSPLTTTLRPPGTGLAAWLRLIIWLVLIGLWAVAAIRVLRPPAGQGRPG
jgi:heme/copper-type cytochrome/quinol oxidase subunit 1